MSYDLLPFKSYHLHTTEPHMRETAAVTEYLRKHNGERFVIFCEGARQAKRMRALFTKEGIAAEVSNSSFGRIVLRPRAVDDFRSGVTRVLCDANLLRDTVVPECDGVMMLGYTVNRQFYEWQFTTPLHPAEGKTRGIIYDFVGNVPRHGLPNF